MKESITREPIDMKGLIKNAKKNEMSINLKTYMKCTNSWKAQTTNDQEKQIGNLNSLTAIKEIKFVIKNFSIKKYLCPDGCIGKFYQYLKNK